jgi:hypothetical protein
MFLVPEQELRSLQREVSAYEREQRLTRAREQHSHSLQIDSLTRLERAWRQELAQWVSLTSHLLSATQKDGKGKASKRDGPEQWLAVDCTWDDSALQLTTPTAPERIAAERKRFEQALKQVNKTLICARFLLVLITDTLFGPQCLNRLHAMEGSAQSIERERSEWREHAIELETQIKLSAEQWLYHPLPLPFLSFADFSCAAQCTGGDDCARERGSDCRPQIQNVARTTPAVAYLYTTSGWYAAAVSSHLARFHNFAVFLVACLLLCRCGRLCR